MDMDKVHALIDTIATKEKAAADLLAKLPRSMALQQMWPEAFECGSVRTRWTGKLMTTQEWRREAAGIQKAYREGGRKFAARTPDDLGPAAIFTITRSDGEYRVFPKCEVPAIIREQPLRVKG